MRGVKLIVVAMLAAAAVTIGVTTYAAGWQSTKDQLFLTVIAAESGVLRATAPVSRFAIPGPSRAEREVWSAIVDQYTGAPGPRRYPIAVGAVARWDGPFRDTPREVYERIVIGYSPGSGRPEAAGAVHDFVLRNARPVRVRCTLPAGSRFAEAEPARGDTGRYLSFTRPGFNLLGNRAVVHVDFSCGPLCGNGAYLVLARERGRWKVIAEYLTWIS